MVIIQITAAGSKRMNCRKLLCPAQVKEIPKVVSEAKRKPSFKEKQEYDKLQEDIDVVGETKRNIDHRNQ